ncbi:MAG: zf-HC2 domain-containing protein [Planctomycetota bacterium]|nr:zf-HC2 domain-containing protein [Planctomycetota bacterium]
MSDRPMISLHDCQGIRSALPRFLDGESGPVEETQIARHLQTCSECQEHHDQLRDEWLLSVRTLSGVEDEEVQQLARATTERITREKKQPAGLKGLLGDLSSVNQWSTTAAALFLLAMLFPGLLPFATDSADAPAVVSLTLISGDVDANGRLDWADFQSLFDWLHQDGPQPRCLAAGDLNGDGTITIEDSVLTLSRLAAGAGVEMTLVYPKNDTDALPCRETCP